MRVVVVGAGLAGLTAAANLRGADCDVVLVEGGSRVGGRARTVRSPFQGGQYAESGAEWIDTNHRRMLALLDRHGLTLLGEGEQWGVIRRWLHRNGRLLSPSEVRESTPGLDAELTEFESVVDDAAAGIADASRPEDHPDARALDSRSLADVAEQAQLGELARLFKRRDAQGEFAAEPAEVSLLFVAQQRANQRELAGGAEVRAHRVAGGLTALTEAMATDLRDVLSLDERLLAVEHGGGGVVVRTSQRSLAADHIVLACSLVPLRAVRFTPGLPARLHRAVHELGYGTVTKTAVQFLGRAWVRGYATTEGLVQRVYEPTIDQPGEQGILMSYCGGDGGREWACFAEGDRVARAAEEMCSMHGFAGAPLGGFSRAWSNEPRYGGSYAVYEPGQVTEFWRVLREPAGRVWLAGEHAATCTGYLEGAVESGENVASRIVAAG